MIEQPPNSPRDANTRERMQAISRMIDEELPAGWGFILMAFPLGAEPGRLNYTSNANHEDAVKIIKGWLKKPENQFGKHV